MNNYGQIERDQGNEVWIMYEPIYRTLVNLDKQRCREVSSQVLSFKSFDRCSYREVSRCPQQSRLDGLRRQEISRSIHLAIERCQDCDKKSIENHDRQARYQEVLRLLKNSFSRREKHRYECNQACNTTKDPNIILNSSKTSLNNKKVKHINPKTHTHTLNKSNEFYISKTS